MMIRATGKFAASAALVASSWSLAPEISILTLFANPPLLSEVGYDIVTYHFDAQFQRYRWRRNNTQRHGPLCVDAANGTGIDGFANCGH